MSEEFVEKLRAFIEANKGKKFHNSDVEQKYYDKVLERKLNSKRTNVKAIKSVQKLIQYYLAERMLDIKSNIPDYIADLLGYFVRNDFVDMFSEVEYETPEVKQLKNPRIEYINNEFYIQDDGNKIKVDYDTNSLITYKLLSKQLKLDDNCWKDFEYTCKVPINSISAATSGHFIGDVILDKITNMYKLNNLVFIADYSISGVCILACYSGLHKSTWICESSLEGRNSSDTKWQTRDWPGHDTIQKGYIYLVRGHHVIASIKGDWDGYYNNISFDKLKTLLDYLS